MINIQRNFFVENIVPSLSKEALLAMSGSFTASAKTPEKNWKMRFLFKNREDFKDFLNQRVNKCLKWT